MNEYTHIDIFATKGIEYILVILFLLALIPFWRYLNLPLAAPLRAGWKRVMAGIQDLVAGIPKGYFLDPTHTWAYLEPSGAVRVGVDDFLLAVTGPLTAITTRKPGETVKRGEILSVLQQDGKSLNIYSPVSGRISKQNRKVQKNPEQVSRDPYDSGWLNTIVPTSWAQESRRLVFASRAEHWLRDELERLKDFFTFSTQKYALNPGLTILQEGGAVRAGALHQMAPEIWKEFQIEFIDAGKVD